jgi:hypothetical protein
VTSSKFHSSVSYFDVYEVKVEKKDGDDDDGVGNDEKCDDIMLLTRNNFILAPSL